MKKMEQEDWTENPCADMEQYHDMTGASWQGEAPKGYNVLRFRLICSDYVYGILIKKERWSEMSKLIKEAISENALTAAAPHMSAIESSEHSIGWLYDSDDAGTEFSENHPIESGECSDAKDIKPATAENLRNELLISWKAWEEDREELSRLRDALSPAREKPLPSNLIHEYAQGYEWRGDGGDYTPTDAERAMIEDAIVGYAGYVDEVFASSAREQALDLSVLERLAKIADEYDEPDENGPFPDIQDAMISIRDLRQIRKLLAAIRAAAPCDELKTVVWRFRRSEQEKWYYAQLPTIWWEKQELVTRQNAEAVIAAKDARIDVLERGVESGGRVKSVNSQYANALAYLGMTEDDNPERFAERIWDEREALKADNKRLREALEWYAETAEGCRKIGSAGDAYRHDLDRDGGETARVAIKEIKP